MGRHVSFLSAVLALLAMVAVSCGSSDSDDLTEAPVDQGVAEEDANGCNVIEKAAIAVLALGVIQVATEDARDHVLCPVGYETTPPMNGDHFPAWQNCGFYTEPLLDEVAVH